MDLQGCRRLSRRRGRRRLLDLSGEQLAAVLQTGQFHRQLDDLVVVLSDLRAFVVVREIVLTPGYFKAGVEDLLVQEGDLVPFVGTDVGFVLKVVQDHRVELDHLPQIGDERIDIELELELAEQGLDLLLEKGDLPGGGFLSGDDLGQLLLEGGDVVRGVGGFLNGGLLPEVLKLLLGAGNLVGQDLLALLEIAQVFVIIAGQDLVEEIDDAVPKLPGGQGRIVDAGEIDFEVEQERRVGLVGAGFLGYGREADDGIGSAGAAIAVSIAPDGQVRLGGRRFGLGIQDLVDLGPEEGSEDGGVFEREEVFAHFETKQATALERLGGRRQNRRPCDHQQQDVPSAGIQSPFPSCVPYPDSYYTELLQCLFEYFGILELNGGHAGFSGAFDIAGEVVDVEAPFRGGLDGCGGGEVHPGVGLHGADAEAEGGVFKVAQDGIVGQEEPPMDGVGVGEEAQAAGAADLLNEPVHAGHGLEDIVPDADEFVVRQLHAVGCSHFAVELRAVDGADEKAIDHVLGHDLLEGPLDVFGVAAGKEPIGPGGQVKGDEHPAKVENDGIEAVCHGRFPLRININHRSFYTGAAKAGVHGPKQSIIMRAERGGESKNQR